MERSKPLLPAESQYANAEGRSGNRHFAAITALSASKHDSSKKAKLLDGSSMKKEYMCSALKNLHRDSFLCIQKGKQSLWQRTPEDTSWTKSSEGMSLTMSQVGRTVFELMHKDTTSLLVP